MAAVVGSKEIATNILCYSLANFHPAYTIGTTKIFKSVTHTLALNLASFLSRYRECRRTLLRYSLWHKSTRVTKLISNFYSPPPRDIRESKEKRFRTGGKRTSRRHLPGIEANRSASIFGAVCSARVRVRVRVGVARDVSLQTNAGRGVWLRELSFKCFDS